jgi:hypothetical protein
MGSYVDFVESVSHNRELAHEFQQSLKKCDRDELSAWFSGKGYVINKEMCESMIKNSKASFTNAGMMGIY